MQLSRLISASILVITMLACSSQPEQAHLNFSYLDYKTPDAILKNKVAPAQKDGKWGWINIYGEWIIPAEYDEKPREWRYGLTVMKKGGFYGVVNAKHQVIIPFEYDKGGIYSMKYHVGHQPFISLRKGENDYQFDLEGKPTKVEYEQLSQYHSLVLKGYYHRHTYLIDSRVVNYKGETQLSFTQEPFICWVGQFRGGMAPIFLAEFNGGGSMLTSGKPILYGYINMEGEIVIPIQYNANYMMSHMDDWDHNSMHFAFEEEEALVRAKDYFFAINKQGDTLRKYNKDYYQVERPNNGIRKAHMDYVNKNNEIISSRDDDVWEPIGINSNGFIIEKSYKLKKLRIINASAEVVYELPQWDDEYYYWLSPFYTDRDSLFVVQRGAIKELKEKGKDYNSVSSEDLESRFITYDLKYASDWIKDTGSLFLVEVGLKINDRIITDYNGNVVFECDSCSIRYYGRDQTNYRGQWGFVIRNNGNGVEYVSFSGFNFSRELDAFDFKFVDTDERIFEENNDENPNFTLKVTENDIRKIFNELFPQERQ